MILVLVVDDSAFMRKSISLMLESDPEIKVIATAREGLEGYNMVKKLRPDLVTMDIEMPGMDGLSALKKIMADCPTPVIMISSITTEGAKATLLALEYGAVDFIPKELSFVNVNIIKIKEELIQKIKSIVKDRRQRIKQSTSTPKIKSESKSTQLQIETLVKQKFSAVALGISTGGPISLQKVIPIINKDIKSPIFIVQHMPPRFTRSLAERLNNMSEITVKEAEDGELVQKGRAYIAPGGYQMLLKKDGSGFAKIMIAEEPITLHRPSVDVMINSVTEFYGKNTLAIIMTGMGKDGLEGVKNLRALGGKCLVQDEESCVVYGMPKSIADAGFADAMLPLENIGMFINKAIL